jgi:hypothetical protein
MLRVSPLMVLHLVWIGGVVVRWAPLYEVHDSVYMLPISSMAFGWYGAYVIYDYSK